MTTLVDHARSMVRYNIWADNRILAAAEGISDEQYGRIRGQFEHSLGTQRYWYGNWKGTKHVDPVLEDLAQARAGFTASHDAIRAFADAMTPEEWDRAEQWWIEWGEKARMALGESITQLFYHGVQHRSEIAVLLSEWGHSPGDLDYLTFLGGPD